MKTYIIELLTRINVYINLVKINVNLFIKTYKMVLTFKGLKL